MTEFDLKNTMRAIDEYAEKCYFETRDTEYKPDRESKVFYYINEWSGWPFYKKALKHRDWKSIKGHIMSNLGLR